MWSSEGSRPSHFGNYAGSPLKSIWALSDSAAIAVSVTGLYSYSPRRRGPGAAARARYKQTQTDYTQENYMSAIDTASLVVAQAAPEGNASMGMSPIISMFVILYFSMIRPQMKRQKEHRNSIAASAKGDEVVTAGGMSGKVTKVNDSYVTVEVSESADKPVEIIMQ
ncbi:hypothetical protein OY671_009098, partial [Metschnikowia pulcherrima]